jgi:hypothetical protein
MLATRIQADVAARAVVVLGLAIAFSPVAAAEPTKAPSTQVPILEDCAAKSDSDEAVVCGRRGRSPYRIPEQREGFDPAGPIDSVSRERHRLLDLGASGIGSCSTSGPGGMTGCDLIRWKEKQEQYAGKRQNNEPKVSIGIGPLKKTLID